MKSHPGYCDRPYPYPMIVKWPKHLEASARQLQILFDEIRPPGFEAHVRHGMTCCNFCRALRWPGDDGLEIGHICLCRRGRIQGVVHHREGMTLTEHH